MKSDSCGSFLNGKIYSPAPSYRHPVHEDDQPAAAGVSEKAGFTQG